MNAPDGAINCPDRERGRRIKALRNERGLTGLELAEKVAVAQRTVFAWERGEGIARGNIILLADALQTTREYLEHGECLEHEVVGNGRVPASALVPMVVSIARDLREHDQRMTQHVRDGGKATSQLATDLRETDEVLRSATGVLEELVLELRALRQALVTQEPPVEAERPRQGSLAMLPPVTG